MIGRRTVQFLEVVNDGVVADLFLQVIEGLFVMLLVIVNEAGIVP